MNAFDQAALTKALSGFHADVWKGDKRIPFPSFSEGQLAKAARHAVEMFTEDERQRIRESASTRSEIARSMVRRLLELRNEKLAEGAE